MNISFFEVAELELDDAFKHYESIQQGLGFRFISEVEFSIARIIKFPNSYAEIGGLSHRCLVHKFPYGLIYQYLETQQEILVVAISHLHRKPEYWLNRLKTQ